MTRAEIARTRPPDDPRVVLEISPAARWITEQYPVEAVEDDGDYSVSFDYSQQRRAQTGAPDLQVRVLDAGSVVATSRIVYDARSDETIELAVEGVARPSEYERVVAGMGSWLPGGGKNTPGTELAALREDDDRSDITYLANKTGWDARLIAYF